MRTITYFLLFFCFSVNVIHGMSLLTDKERQDIAHYYAQIQQYSPPSRMTLPFFIQPVLFQPILFHQAPKNTSDATLLNFLSNYNQMPSEPQIQKEQAIHAIPQVVSEKKTTEQRKTSKSKKRKRRPLSKKEVAAKTLLLLQRSPTKKTKSLLYLECPSCKKTLSPVDKESVNETFIDYHIKTCGVSADKAKNMLKSVEKSETMYYVDCPLKDCPSNFSSKDKGKLQWRIKEHLFTTKLHKDDTRAKEFGENRLVEYAKNNIFSRRLP